MDTVEQAITSLQQNETPFWWLWQGNSKVGQNVRESDMQTSVQLLRNTLAILPSGPYRIEHSQNAKDRSGSFKFPFTKGSTVSASMQPAQAPSNNPWGVSDVAYQNIVDEAKHKFRMEALAERMGKFLDEWPDYKKKIDTLWNEDEDGDGKPDILKSVKDMGEAVGAIGQMKNVFKGASLFEV